MLKPNFWHYMIIYIRVTFSFFSLPMTFFILSAKLLKLVWNRTIRSLFRYFTFLYEPLITKCEKSYWILFYVSGLKFMYQLSFFTQSLTSLKKLFWFCLSLWQTVTNLRKHSSHILSHYSIQILKEKPKFLFFRFIRLFWTK